MKLIDVLKSEKEVSHVKNWTPGKIPSSAFPLEKGTKSIPTGGDWHWRYSDFNALGEKFRIFMRINEEKSKFHSVLMLLCENGAKVICHHEFHAGHKGWHCHVVRGNIHDTKSGVMRDIKKMRSIDASISHSPDMLFTVNKSNALSIVSNKFRLLERGGLFGD